MRVIVQAVSVLSLVICLGAAVFRFIDLAGYSTYTTVLGIFSVVYFVAATTWSEMRR